jgi:sugar O-acyltransferase (sialic acid O-acetyltransferase NeuD family)
VRKKPLILIGDSVFAQVAFEFFQFDSPYEVIAFSVEREFLVRDHLFDRPVVAFEDLEGLYPPAAHSVFVALVFTQFNRLRTRLYQESKRRGYRIASYISSAALIRPNTRIDQHCFICEDVVIQPFTRIERNVVIWSGTQICHRCNIGDNVFVLPNCVISDGVSIGENSIIGANVTIWSDRKVAEDCYIGPAMFVDADVSARSILERIPTGSAPALPQSEPAS